MAAYYNELDPFAAAWLRELIKAKQIADGEVDERSIADVRPDDLRGFTQCHFFAGIGGWSLALRLAGWPDDRPVWTGSCPCQPFSLAGKGDGAADSRHLWPTWLPLIRERRPGVVFGEQVASADGLGWFDRVSTDLEEEDYAVGAVDLCAASVGADHIRARLWFVADADGDGFEGVSHGRHAGAPSFDEARRSARRTVTARAAYTKRREWSLGGTDGRVGRQDAIAWHGHWETAPEPFIRRGIDGIPSRMAQLRGYGNAIVPQVAAAFIESYLECVA